MKQSFIACYFLSLALFFIAPSVNTANICVDINTAPQEELEKIKHIGESRAKQIIILRGEKLFSSVDDLDRVVGIGPARVSDIKQEGLACVQTPAPTTETEIQPIIEVEPLAEVRPPSVEVEPQSIAPVAYPSGIIFSEIMPSPEGADETEEWIEILNQNNFEADLSGWQITDTAGKTNIYTLPAGTKISAMGFLVLSRPETKIILNNDNDGLKLIQPNGKIIDSVSYEKAPQGQSYGLINSDWVWSKNPTPGTTNVITAKASASDKPARPAGGSSADKSAGKDTGLAAISEPVAAEQDRRNFYPFLAAFALAIFSGFVILFLKKKINS